MRQWNAPALIVRRRGWIALLWALVAAAFLPGAGKVADRLEVGASVEGSESAAVERLLAGPLHSHFARFAVLVIGGIAAPTTVQGSEALHRVLEPLQAADEVSGVVSYLNRPDTLFFAPANGGTFAMVGLRLGAKTDHLIPRLRAITEGLTARLRADYPALTLRWTGESALNVDLRRTSTEDVGGAERRTLPITAIFLLFAFGALVAALIPVISGALSIAIALGIAALLARVWPLALLLQSMVTMLGLGLGIDYALLMVSRFREAVAAGEGPEAAAESAARHAGHTILLSAATVSLGFVALLTVPLNEIRAIAVGGLLVVVASALLATTLLPGVLAWLGPRIDWGRIRRRGARPSGDGWRRLGRLVTGHPWTALCLSGVPLLILAVQAGRLRTGLPRGNWLPASMESARALDDLRSIGRGNVIQGIRLVLELPEGQSVRRSAGWGALTRFVDSLSHEPNIDRIRSMVAVAREAGMGRSSLAFLPDSVTAGLVSQNGRLALVEILPRESVTPEGTVTLARRLRSAGAAAAQLTGARVIVGGLPAFNADYQDAVAGRFGRIVLLVVGGTFLVMAVGMRSILVPLKAVLLNLLSVGAAFGALTLVFQEGHGGRLLGVAEPLGAVFSSLPLVVFCIVFGLSMDYEVFLMTRVMEMRRMGASDRDAIVDALGTTGPVITNAAAIMLVVFAAFTTGDFLMLKMLGFSLAIAVFVDATVVRIVIGPALLQLAGRWNWWPGGGAHQVQRDGGISRIPGSSSGTPGPSDWPGAWPLP